MGVVIIVVTAIFVTCLTILGCCTGNREEDNADILIF